MTTLVSPAPAAVQSSWDEPDGVAARGTLVVLAGRGETAAAYARFGRRLAADAYRVRVVEPDLDDPDRTTEQVAGLLDDAGLPAPRVLVGADAGATYAALLAQSERTRPDALVLAGLVLPGSTQPAPDEWEQELEARSACPAHRRVLGADASFERGALARELPASWRTALPLPPELPALVVHGSDDQVTPVDDLLAALGEEGAVAVVRDGRHDVLNDVTHRSVAATVVLFLERLRVGAELPLLVREHTASR